MLTENMARYSRQLMIPEIGLQGQMKLHNSKVLVVGAGGLGCPILLYLTAAGVGSIGIVDFDDVDLSNLQRQILFSEADIGKSKALRAAEKLSSMNANIKITTIQTSLTKDNVLDVVSDYDVVVDASDNFLTRYVLNDACCIRSIPLIYGSLFRLEGQVSVFNLNEDAPCYRCLYPSPPPTMMIPNCSEGGVLGSVAGIIGSLQATECVKVLLGKGYHLSGKVMHLNLLDLDFSLLSIKKSSSCIVCGQGGLHKSLNPAWYAFDSFKQVCSRIKNISSEALITSFRNHRDEITLINVKELWENTAVIPAFKEISMPLSIIESTPDSVAGQLSHQGKNVFYCTDGSRSEHAISIIERTFGYSNLYNFQGNPHIILNGMESTYGKNNSCNTTDTLRE